MASGARSGVSRARATGRARRPGTFFSRRRLCVPRLRDDRVPVERTELAERRLDRLPVGRAGADERLRGDGDVAAGRLAVVARPADLEVGAVLGAWPVAATARSAARP